MAKCKHRDLKNRDGLNDDVNSVGSNTLEQINKKKLEKKKKDGWVISGYANTEVVGALNFFNSTVNWLYRFMYIHSPYN